MNKEEKNQEDLPNQASSQTEKPSFDPTSIRLSEDFMSPNSVMQKLEEDPKKQNLYHGGWGYEAEDACLIFEKKGQGTSDEGISAEYDFAELRIYVECVLSPIKYKILDFKLFKQELIFHKSNGKAYDRLTYEITIVLLKDDENISDSTGDNHADVEVDEKNKITFQEKFYFDISNFN